MPPSPMLSDKELRDIDRKQDKILSRLAKLLGNDMSLVYDLIALHDEYYGID